MSLESDLNTILKTVTARVFPDVVPEGTAAPYVVWQGLGGKSMRQLNNQAADKRNTLLQVSVWSPTRLEAVSLIRQIEDALCAANQFICTPYFEPRSDFDDETRLYGSIQRFSIYSTR